MSDRQSLIVAHLSDGPQTVDQLVELTGLERSAVAQELTAMKNAGLAYSGRGGWRLSDGAPGKPRRHEAVDPPEAPGAAADRASARKRMRENRAAKKAGATPKPAAAEVARDASLQPGARYVFGITELGELIVTDRKHAEKTATFSAVDTARLALALKRWATLIDVREAA